MGTEVLPTDYRIAAFDGLWAGMVATWVRSKPELFWLAPRTEPPLTASKVRDWRRPGGYPLMWVPAGGVELPVPAEGTGDASPIGYAELNPMRGRLDQYWMGHVLLQPASRGCGLGVRFVAALLDWARDDLRAERVSLVVFPNNAPAIACYRRVGMTLVGEEYHTLPRMRSKCRLLRFERELTRRS